MLKSQNGHGEDRCLLRRDLFKTVSSQWPSGVAVVTAVDESGAPHGLTMSAVLALSLDPMQYLISVDRNSTTLPSIKSSSRFCINFLSKTQVDVGRHFASKSANKFSSMSHRISDWGPPIIPDAVSAIICHVSAVLPAGDHEMIVGDVLDMEHRGGEPLVYFNRGFYAVGPGHAAMERA